MPWTLNSLHVNFQDFRGKFSFISGQLCDKKTCAFVVMGIGKKVVWAEGGMGRGRKAKESFLLVCVYVFVGRRVGRVGIIRHPMLL